MKAAREVVSIFVRMILILALVMGTASSALAQAPAAKQKPVAATAKTQPAAKPSGGPQEGIKVHGHWVIEVRNPDGSLVTRREFENSLAPGGGRLLAQWLNRAGSPARWTVELGDYTLTGPCNGGTFNGNPTLYCFIVDSAANPMPSGTAVFATLTSIIGGANADQIIITGNATAISQGQIEYVATRQGTCVSFTAPRDCNAPGTVLQFTVHDLRNAQGQPAPLSLAAGQIVQVTLTISFSGT